MENTPFSFKITDLIGTSILEGNGEESSMKLSIESLPAGIYIISMNGNQGIQAKRLIISR
jgi:hypothetical protein